MRAGNRINYDDSLVVVMKDGKEVYRGIEDYNPMKGQWWKFVETTKDGRGHYEYNGYKKYLIQ